MELLVQGARTWERQIERNVLENYRLTYAQYCVLEVVYEAHQIMSMGELADKVNTSRGNMSGIVDKLERRGWLTRTQSLFDKRMYYVGLASERAAMLESVVRAVQAHSPDWPAPVRECITKLVRRA